MKLVNTETNQFTTIKKNEFGWYEYEDAANRLIARVMPGYSADSIAHYNLDNRPETTKFEVEAVRGVGGLTEHSGELFYFEIVK